MWFVSDIEIDSRNHDQTNLLFHMCSVELVLRQLGVVDRFISVVLTVDDSLDLLDKAAAGESDCLGCALKFLLGLGHKAGLDTTGSDELCG